MSGLRQLLSLPRRIYRRIPLSVRVALLLTPVIVISQFATLVLLRNTLPVSVLRSGVDFGPPRPPPRFMSEPGFDGLISEDRYGILVRRSANSVEIHRFPPPNGPGRSLELDREGDNNGIGDPRFTFKTRHWMPPWQHLFSSFCVTALIVWIAAWWLMRPLARLASAAERLGRNVESEPLAESGPPEVRRAAAAFNRMQDRLLRFIHGRSDALLAMSHDLKTPITRLQLRVALLPQALQGPISEDVGLLQARVEDALSFMQGVHGDEPMQDVDVNALAALTVERLQDTGAQVSLSGSAPPLRCRPGQLERALSNVLDNAVRYAGHAELQILDSRESLVLSICDRGPGIPEELIARVTEPFFRVESSRSRDSGGTGLGLAIAKDLVESIGGHVQVRNRAGGGLEVRLELPRQLH